MSDQKLPKKPREQDVVVNLPLLLLGCATLGIGLTAVGLGVVTYRDRLRIRRQNALMDGISQLMQTLIEMRGDSPDSGTAESKGGA